MALVVCVSLGALPWHDRALGGDGPPAKKADHPLPKYFDKLDLTAEQQKKVFALMDEYDEKIEQHQEQIRKLRGKPFVTSIILAHANEIKKLRGQRSAALEKVLNDEQRARLKELQARDEAAKKP
jgi:Spy/CpxP family protein refolding chaperone